MRQGSTKFGRYRMNVTKFLETMCRLLSEQEGIKLTVHIDKKEGGSDCSHYIDTKKSHCLI